MKTVKKHLDKILMATAGLTVAAGAATGAVFAFYHPKTEGPHQRNRDATITSLNNNNMTFYSQSLIGIYKSGMATDILIQGVSKGTPVYSQPLHVVVNKENESVNLPLVDGTYHVEIRNSAKHNILNWELHIDAHNFISFSKNVSYSIDETKAIDDSTSNTQHTSLDTKVYADYQTILTLYSGVSDQQLLVNINREAKKAHIATFSAKDVTDAERTVFADIGKWGIGNSNTSKIFKSQLIEMAKLKSKTVIQKAYSFTNGTDTFVIIQSDTGTDAAAGRHYSEAVSGAPFKVLGVTINPVKWAFEHNQRATKQLGIRFHYSAAFDNVTDTALTGNNATIYNILKNTLLGTQ